MKTCVVCGAATLLLYFDGRPLCLDCDHVGEEATPALDRLVGGERSPSADTTPRRSEQWSRATSLV
jgi:hypothetical protein